MFNIKTDTTMKTIKSIFATAIMLFFATSCQDEPVAPFKSQNFDTVKRNQVIVDDEIIKTNGLDQVLPADSNGPVITAKDPNKK